jgi:hypothetical protein
LKKKICYSLTYLQYINTTRAAGILISDVKPTVAHFPKSASQGIRPIPLLSADFFLQLDKFNPN